MSVGALRSWGDRAIGAIGSVHRRVVGPRRHTGPLPFVPCAPSLKPILPVVDLAAATEFYERLGFEVAAYDDGYAWVRHCGWEWFHLRRVDSTDGNRASAYLHVADPDAWHAGMLAASGGTAELGAVADMPWGMREYALDDPDGNHIRIGCNIAA